MNLKYEVFTLQPHFRSYWVQPVIPYVASILLSGEYSTSGMHLPSTYPIGRASLYYLLVWIWIDISRASICNQHNIRVLRAEDQAAQSRRSKTLRFIHIRTISV